MIPGDRLICAFIEDRPYGSTFTDWPLHITIVPWFRTDRSSDELAIKIMQNLIDVEPFLATAGEEAGFGRGGRKTVNLIDAPSPLEEIEQTVRRVLHSEGAWIVDETTKKQRAFRPHVTLQKAGRLHPGDSFRIENVYIVEQKGEYKEVMKAIQL